MAVASAIKRRLSQSARRYAWDTRCRNGDVSRALRPLFADASREQRALLDVGCGVSAGVAPFLTDVRVLGVDLVEPPRGEGGPNFTFQHADIRALPFEARSFPVVSCVDVLEHLPLDVRAQAVDEVVRVAGDHLVIASPCEQRATDSDARFLVEHEARGRPPPDWLREHLAQPHPEVAELVARIATRAASLGRTATTRVSFSEPLRIVAPLRTLAVRSSMLYRAGSILLGLAYPLIPAPAAANSYRAILVTDFRDAHLPGA